MQSPPFKSENVQLYDLTDPYVWKILVKRLEVRKLFSSFLVQIFLLYLGAFWYVYSCLFTVDGSDLFCKLQLSNLYLHANAVSTS